MNSSHTKIGNTTSGVPFLSGTRFSPFAGAVDRIFLVLNTHTDTSHCIAGSVPHKYKEDPSLGRWVDSQRSVFNTGKMDLEREKRLDEIDFKDKDIVNNHITTVRGEANHDGLNSTAYILHKVQPQQQQPQGGESQQQQ
jgi:hypothetical protein